MLLLPTNLGFTWILFEDDATGAAAILTGGATTAVIGHAGSMAFTFRSTPYKTFLGRISFQVCLNL